MLSVDEFNQIEHSKYSAHAVQTSTVYSYTYVVYIHMYPAGLISPCLIDISAEHLCLFILLPLYRAVGLTGILSSRPRPTFLHTTAVPCCHRRPPLLLPPIPPVERLFRHVVAKILEIHAQIYNYCGLRYLKALAARKLWNEGATEAALEILRDTRVGC